MEQFLVGMLNRQGGILRVDFNDWENKVNENYFNGKMKNAPPFQDATAIIMNEHHEAVTVTKCAGKRLQNTFIVFVQFLPTKTLLLLQ